jgi:hypothetical protein
VLQSKSGGGHTNLDCKQLQAVARDKWALQLVWLQGVPTEHVQAVARDKWALQLVWPQEMPTEHVQAVARDKHLVWLHEYT